MNFNIRKLKIQRAATERKLKTCDPRSRDRLRAKLKAQEFALRLARQLSKEARAATVRKRRSELYQDGRGRLTGEKRERMNVWEPVTR